MLAVCRAYVAGAMSPSVICCSATSDCRLTCMAAEMAGCSAVTVDAPPDDPGGAAAPNAANKAEIVSAWPPPGAAAELDIALVGGAVTAGTCTNGKAT